MPLPYPGKTFTPFDTLPASDLNEMAANDDALAAGTGLNSGAVTPDKRSGGFGMGNFASQAGAGSFSVTTLDFTPKKLNFTVVKSGNDNTYAHMSTGRAMSSTLQNYGLSVSTPTISRNRSGSNACVVGADNSGGVFSIPLVGALVSMNTNGFTLNFSASTTGYTIYWEAWA